MANPAATQAIDVGTIVAGSYQITRLLGKGGMGAVWEAQHMRLVGTRVAIKVLHAEVAGDAESVARFHREAQIASRLGHPNIVQVLDFNELPDGTQYLVLEYLEGESLAERLARGRLALPQALAIVRQVSSALHAAHREHIVHRDLKPHNIFLCPTEAGGFVTEQAKVLDFGISKIRGSQTVKTQASTMLGTPQYMAPEQALGDHANVDARTDIFALGAIVYEMLVGRPAFQGSTIPEVVFKVVYEEPPRLSQLVPGLDVAVVQTVHRALAKKQEERFADVSSFVEALTGAPLTTLRSSQGAAPLVPVATPSVATGGARVETQDALAATVPPGQEVQATVALGPARTQTGPGIQAEAIGLSTPGVRPESFAATMAHDSTAGQGPVSSSMLGPGPTRPGIITQGAGQVEPARKSRTSPVMLIAVVVAAVVAAVAVTVFIMRPPPAAPDVTETHAASTEKTDVKVATPETGTAGNGQGTAGQPTGAQNPAIAGPGETKPDDSGQDNAGDPAETTGGDKTGADGTTDAPKKRSRPSGSKQGAGEPTRKEALAKLASARSFLQSGNYAYAVRDARSSIDIEPTQAAYSVIVMAYCTEHNFSNARANVVHLRGPAKKRVIRYCAKYDVDLRDL